MNEANQPYETNASAVTSLRERLLNMATEVGQLMTEAAELSPEGSSHYYLALARSDLVQASDAIGNEEG